MKDRLSIENKINDKLIPKIDDNEFLGLDKNHSSRIELFMFALALGVKEGKRTPLKTQHGFILESSIKAYEGAMSCMVSLLLDELKETNEEDKIDNKDEVFICAEEYANTGFEIISKLVNNEDDDTILFDFIDEMNKKYSDIIG